MTYSLNEHFKWSWNLSKNYRVQLFLYFLLEVIAIVFSLLFVYYSKKSVDIALNVIPGNLLHAIIMVVASIILGIIIRVCSTYLNQKTQLKFTVQLQNEIIRKQMNSVWQGLKKWFTGDLMVRVNTDCVEVVQMISNSGISFIVTSLKLIASFTFLWVIDPMLAIMILAISPLFAFSKLYFKKLRKLNRDVKQSESEVGNIIQENLRFRILIRSLGILPKRHTQLTDAQDQTVALKIKQLNFNLFAQTVMKAAINIGYLVAFIWGVYRLHHNEITFGTMTAFLQLVGRIQSPILSLIAFFPAFIRFRTAADRLIEIEKVEQEPTSEPSIVSFPQSIVFENVSFKYEDDYVIQNLNAEITVGNATAIVGASGKGKTTLIRLMLALVKPEDGQIVIKNEKGEFIQLSSAHRLNFSYVPQGNSLFAGTIKENLSIVKEGVSDVEIQRVLKIACADFVFDLNQGLETLIGEQGLGLSEGQAQRIAIARALLRGSHIMLFDEATSALDEATANQLMGNLLEFAQNRILLFVTHDRKVANQCSQTIFMN